MTGNDTHRRECRLRACVFHFQRHYLRFFAALRVLFEVLI
jgi:hypothetical protein